MRKTIYSKSPHYSGMDSEVPKEVIIPREVFESALKLFKEHYPKIVCGFVIGKEPERGKFVVEEFYPLPTIQGKSVHFKPRRSAYNAALRKIEDELGKMIIGEFHTHPDDVEELKPYDLRVLRRLGHGFWFIITSNTITPWYYSKTSHREIITEEGWSVIAGGTPVRIKVRTTDY